MLNENLRRMALGGSEIGAIFGCDEWTDAFTVWARKKGGLEPQPPNDRMIVGKILEPAVLKLYEHKTGRAIRYCDETMQHPSRRFQVATPDAFCVDSRRGIDAKVVFYDQRRNWGPTADDIPERVILQAWWYMSAFDYAVWDIAVLIGDGMPRIYEIERDEEAERVMLARAEEFHARYLVGDERPPITGSPASSAWLQQAFANHKRPDLRPASDLEMDTLHEYAQVRLEQKALEQERAALENILKLAVGEREGLVWADGKFTWRRCKDRSVTDWKSLALGLLTKFVPEEEMQATLLTIHSSVKEGSRRIWFDYAGIAEMSDAA